MKKKTETFKYVSWADEMKKSDITGTPKEDVKATLKDLPFAMARAEANKLMSYRYNPTTGTFMNDNGDETKDAKAAVKYNKELDDVLGSQNQVSETKSKIQKKIFPNKKLTKPLSQIDLIYAVSDPKEKAEMRREYKDWNFVLKREKPKIETKMPTPVPTPTIVPIVNVVPEEKPIEPIVVPVFPPKRKLGLEGAWVGDVVYERRLNNNMLPKKERTLERKIINKEENNDR